MADYVVDAQLNLRSHDATRGARGFLSALSGVTNTLGRIGVGALGFGAITGLIRGAAGALVGFNSEVEGTSIALASVFSAVENVSFDRALNATHGIFQQLQQDAVRSTATTQELFGIYQSILGPIRGAGAGLEDVHRITLGTVNAATALGVDLAQAQRDIGMMATGTAGVDVKLFRMLRSTGAIREDAQAFNDLTATERINKIKSALERFSGAADAYSRSWAGVVSTFQDVKQQFIGALAGPIFERLKRFLGAFNERLIANFSRIQQGLASIGERIGRVLDPVFAHALAGLDFVMAHWDEIVARIREGVDEFRAMLPHLMQAAKAFVALRIAFGAASGVLSAISGIQGLLGALGMGGSAAAAGGAVAGEVAVAGTAGAGASGVALFFEALTAAAGPLLAVLTPILGLIVFLSDEWSNVLAVLQPFVAEGSAFGELFGKLREVFGALWTVLRPVLKALGFLVFVGLTLLVSLLTLVARAVTAVIEWFQPLIDGFRQLGEAIATFVNDIIGRFFDAVTPGAVATMSPVSTGAPVLSPTAEAEQLIAEQGGAERSRNVTNFNGPINVRQEFREADPDRVAFQMIDDIARAAENRLTSGFAPPLTR